MTDSISVTVRVPSQLKSEGQKLVNEGYFKNLSEFFIFGAHQAVQTYHPSKAVMEAREAKAALSGKYLKKAKGDEEKAMHLLFEDINKDEEEYFKTHKV